MHLSAAFLSIPNVLEATEHFKFSQSGMCSTVDPVPK